MLTCLRVRNFAIIDHLEVELSPGLNVVTGETGAGKSILVDALELVLGAKARPEVVRTGESRAEVEALFDVSGDAEVRARLAAAGLEVEDEVVVRRVVHSSGRTRAYVDGRLASATQLKQMAAGLADISSQHEHHSLIDPRRHLEYLDAFGSLGELRGEVRGAHRGLAAADERVRSLRERVASRSEREDLLRYQIQEIDTVAPEDGEEDALVSERGRLRHAERLASAAALAEQALYTEDRAICSEVGKLVGELRSAAELDPALSPLAEQVEEARAQLEDAARELGAYARGVALDPARLSEVEDRLDALKRLLRKYGGTAALVLGHRASAAAELETLTSAEEALDALEAEREQALEAAREVAKKLRRKRERAASKLGGAISAELQLLGMGDAEVRVDVAPLEGAGTELNVDGARLSPTGIDRVEFLIAPNRGEQARPLRKVASGGELSRSLLAIKRVLAGLRPTGLYVFDEVDSGVGGAVAEVIGHKLRDVARHHQVLCITHLPQIAVFADQHLRVSKEVVDGRTRSRVERLDPAQQLEEIARMLGGVQVTQRTRAAAAEMLRLSRASASPL